MAEQPHTPTPAPAAARAFTPRALLLGLGCVVFLSAVTPYTYLVMQGSELAANHLPAGAMVIFLLFVVAVNGLLAGLRSRLLLSRGELLLIYIMMIAAAAVPARAFLMYVLTVPAGGLYYGTPESGWQTALLPYMKPWLAPRDPQAVTWFFQGLPPGRGIPWAEWLVPMAAWGLFFIFFAGASMSLALLVRKRWVHDEHLTFPLAQVPLELAAVDEKRALPAVLRSKPLLLGLAAGLGFHVVQGGQRYLPSLPDIAIANVPIISGQMQLPLSNLEGTGLHFYPSAIGVGFLLGSEVGLSIWLFWLLGKLQMYMIGLYGQPVGSTTGFWGMQICARGQQVGAFYLMAGLMLWDIRRRLADAVLRRKGSGDTPEEQREVRLAASGLLAGLALMWGWCLAAGMTPGYALAAIALYLVIAFVLARLVAQAGVFFAAWSGEFLPSDMLGYPLGLAAVGKANAFVIYLHQAIFLNDRRTITMPFLTDGLRISDAGRLPVVRAAGAMLLAAATAVVVSYVVGLTLYYRHGAVNLWDMSSVHIPTWTYNRLKERLVTQLEPDRGFVWWTAIGAAVMVGLVWLQRTFLWWRLSPVGYLMGWSPALEQIAGSFFLGWLASTLVMRYSGLRLYRAARPLFIGLIIGEFLGVALWLVVDALTGVTGHALFPAGGAR